MGSHQEAAGRPRTYFISGHIDLTEEEFAAHYALKIVEAYHMGHNFVVGDCRGADEMAQRLLGGLIGARYRVFHMFDRPRCNPNGTRSLVGGFRTDEERDAAMTRWSDEDIAWVRPGKSKKNSGTAKNLRRRQEYALQRRIAARASWPRIIIEQDYGDGPELVYIPKPNEDRDLAHDERRVPVPPGFMERYTAAVEAWYAAEQELKKYWFEQEALGD